MIILDILCVIAGVLMLAFVVADFVLLARNIKYQVLWNKKKAKIVKIDPAITRAELCEQYVIFCKVNRCKVEY
jgi:hypothetical protein